MEQPMLDATTLENSIMGGGGKKNGEGGTKKLRYRRITGAL